VIVELLIAQKVIRQAGDDEDETEDEESDD